MSRRSNPTMIPLGAMAAGFGLALCPAGAFAQTTLPVVTVTGKADAPAKENLQTTSTTIGKGTQDIRDVPQSLTVVTEKLLDDAKLDTLKQALHYTAGITFAATENGTDQDIRLRGFPVATTGDLLIDGMKDPSQYDRDSFNYDRIEVLRGSASMLFGRGSTGGVINQVTKKPVLADMSEVVNTIGTGSSWRFTGDFNVRTGEQSALRVNTMLNVADNHGARIEKEGIAPTVAWGIGTGDEFTAGLFLLNVDNVPPSSLRYVNGSIASGIPAKNFYGSASDYVRGEAAFASGSWLHRFADAGELRTQLRSGNFKRASWGTTATLCSVALTVTGTCPAGSPPVTDGTLNDSTVVARLGLAPRQDSITGTYLQSDYTNKFMGWGLQHQVTTGVDAAFEHADRHGAYGAVGTNYDKGGTTVGRPNDGSHTAALPTYRKTSDYAGTAFGGYVQDLLSLTPSWKLLGGLRYDRFKATMSQINYTSPGTTPAGSLDSELSYPSLWSSRAGVLFQPSASQSYHLSYGTSFNTSADTYQYTTQQIADVAAEKSRNVELGAKLDWLDGKLSTRLAIFRTEKFNERTTDADFAGTFPVLSGQRHSQGFEVDVVGRVTRALEVYLSYSHITEAKIDKAGSAIAAGTAGSDVGLTPKHSGALWASYQLSPEFRVAGGARGASKNRPLQGGTGAASTNASVPGYVVYDAMVEYNINPDVFTQLNVSNVADKVYGDQLYPAFYTPGEARAVKLTLGVRF